MKRNLHHPHECARKRGKFGTPGALGRDDDRHVSMIVPLKKHRELAEAPALDDGLTVAERVPAWLRLVIRQPTDVLAKVKP